MMGKHSAPKKQNKKQRRQALAIVGGLATFSLIGAFATTLGGVTSTQIGGDQTIVAACDTDGVSVDYNTSWDATVDDPNNAGPSGAYVIDDVVVSGIAAGCNGQTISVTVSDSTAGYERHQTGTVAGTSITLTLNQPAIVTDSDYTSIIIEE